MISVIEKIQKKNRISQPNTYKTYTISHTYEDKPVIISVPLTYNEIDLLAAYAQFKADELQHAFHLSVDAMVRILKEVFRANEDNFKENTTVLDLYEIWEYWCPKAGLVSEINLFKNNKELNELIADIVKSNFE